jgi:hypothetical protein
MTRSSHYYIYTAQQWTHDVRRNIKVYTTLRTLDQPSGAPLQLGGVGSNAIMNTRFHGDGFLVKLSVTRASAMLNQLGGTGICKWKKDCFLN